MAGPGTRDERIEKLEKSLGKKGVKNAAEIFEGFEADEIKLAYLYCPVTTPGKTLGKRVEALILACPKNQQKAMRETLMKAKGI